MFTHSKDSAAAKNSRLSPLLTNFGKKPSAHPNRKLVMEETKVDVVFKHLNDKQLKIEVRVLLPNTHPLLRLTLTLFNDDVYVALLFV
jgi:hypothetical protein